jgi:hypothetical protein
MLNFYLAEGCDRISIDALKCKTGKEHLTLDRSD